MAVSTGAAPISPPPVTVYRPACLPNGLVGLRAGRTFSVTMEFSPRIPGQLRAEPLMANVGGFLSGCQYGLTGLVQGPDEPGAWRRRPAVMPDLWEGIDVERVWVRGQPMRLTATHGTTTRLESLG
jgi:hypothetical protein